MPARPGFVASLLIVVLFAVGGSYGQPAAGDYSEWLQADPYRPAEVRSFELFLRGAGVDSVLPTDQLLLNATEWKRCKLDAPFTLPPRPIWAHIVATLKFLRDDVVPAIGPVNAESGYREPKLNLCAGGAPKSAHAGFYALDLVPVRPMARATLITFVCKLHRDRGRRYDIGLGFYDGLRFHIDSKGFRRWGSDNHSGTSPCVSALRV